MEWKGWVLYVNNDVETWPKVVVIENQRPPMQKPPHVKVQSQPPSTNIWPSQQPLLSASFRTTIDVICAKPKI